MKLKNNKVIASIQNSNSISIFLLHKTYIYVYSKYYIAKSISEMQ